MTASGLTGSDRVASAFQFDVTQIREPVLIAHNHKVDFWVMPASKTEPLEQELINTTIVDVFLYEGGRMRGDACKARHYHGF